MSEPKIYCWINAGKGTDWVVSMAMAEDGTHLTSHVSSSDGFAKGDCGYLPTGMGLSKRAIFDEHYPDGYELEWVDDPAPGKHAGLDVPYALNQATRTEEAAA